MSSPQPAKRDEEKRDHNDWVSDRIRDLQEADWFGTVTIKMEGGVVKRMILETSLLPPKKNSFKGK